MSFKAKNLTYESNEPAFLRRLRGEAAGAGDPDRHGRSAARPVPKRLKGKDDEDDGPTYVEEESGDTISKADYEALLAGDEKKADADGDMKPQRPNNGEEPDSKSRLKQQSLAEAGQARKKRKVAKVVGDIDEEEDGVVPDSKEKPSVKKPKKKSKVKLSFEDEG